MDVALLVLRVVVGLLVAGHGAQKLFGWFGGHGIAGFSKGLESMGFRPAQLWAWLAGVAEFAGGVLFTVGLLNPLGSIGIASSMLTAIARVHWPRVWATDRGLELPLTYLVVALTVGAVGPGQYALDTALRIAVPHSVTVVSLALALVGWVVGMTLSARGPSPLQRDS
jgi:putative oxidoreductase